MKGILLSATMAAGLGAIALAPANAAPIATHGVIVAPEATSSVACRTVKKVVYSRGVKRVTTTRSCDRPTYVRRDYVRRDYGPARPYYRPYRPGVNIGVRVR